MDLIHFVGKTIIGFVGECCRDNAFYAGTTSGIGQKARINSVAGNNPERIWNFHEARLTMEPRSTQAQPRLTPPAALHVELRQRLLQGSLNGRALFRSEIFFHRFLGPRDRGFRGMLVDRRRLKRHIGED